MEERENFGVGHAVVGDEAPASFHVAPRIENNLDFSRGTMPVPVPATEGKKKRGRPRKYGPDGRVMSGTVTALSPMPISSSIPLTGEFSAWKRGEGIAYSVGANFTPHVLTVNAGEDVTMKIMSFSQQGSRAICILSATGTISNVTLRQPSSSGGTLTYEGRFEILSLSGSFMPTENGVTRSRSGGMSVSLAGPDGRVMGGGLAGLLVAAGPVQVVVASFLPGHQLEHKSKKQRVDHISTITSSPVNLISSEEIKVSFGGVKPIMTPAAFQEENIASFNNVQDSRNSSADDKDPLPEKESNLSQSNAEAAC
ncbi:PPC domain [Sesbania bispinosa]|nr:PPC domain [Sesbania bispinosa]